jgi:hypothetical protein
VNPDTEKYKALYEYSKERFEEERQRFIRLEDKAFKYLTSLTVAFSAYLLLIRSIYEKIQAPYDFLGTLVIISVAVTFYGACSAWSFIFRAIRLQKLVKLPAGNDIIKLFKDHKKAEIYLGLSRNYSEALQLVSKEYEIKLHHVRKGYNEVAFTGWSFLVSTTLIFFYLWR